jgi:hypothetical protein
MTREEEDAVIAQLVAEYKQEEEENAELMALLTGPFAEVRDRNHVEPAEFLVWDRRREPEIESVPLYELTLRYPCGGPEDGWCLEDLGKMTMKKGLLYRQSVVAHELSDEDPTATPTCGSVVLITRTDPEGVHRWLVEKSAIEPEG